MPPEQLGDYLLGYWHDIGRHGYAGMGPVPLDDAALRAWRENVCIDLSPWEVRTVKDLSRAYLAELAAAEDPLRPPPFGSVADQFDRNKLAARLSQALSAAARATTGPRRK